MGKLKEKMEKLCNTKLNLAEVFKYAVIVNSTSLVHCFLLGYFIYTGVVPLIIFNACSVLLYFAMNILVKREQFSLCFLLTYIEICLHTFVAIFALGRSNSFMCYNFVLIPVSYYVSYTSNTFKNKLLCPTILTGFNLLLTVGCNIYLTYYDGSSVVLLDNQRALLNCFNVTVSYLFIVIFSVFFVVDIRNQQSQLQRQNKQLNYYAKYDPLTAFLNRRSMDEKMVEYQKEDTEKICIVLSDIDDFKNINDIYGHDCGDKVLVHICSIMQGLLPDFELCRWGGEEFLFLWKGMENECRERMEYVRSAIEKTEFFYQGQKIKFTMTFGVQQHVPGVTMKETINQADAKLYRGKQSGKNCIV